MRCSFFFSSRRRHTRWTGDWSSDVCSSDVFGLHWRDCRWGALVRCCGSKCVRAATDAEEIQGFDGAGDPGAGDFVGGRGWADLRRICGCVERVVSGYGGYVRGNARGRSGSSGPAAGDVPAAIWRTNSADPAGKRERVFAAESNVVGAPAGSECGATAGGSDGNGGAALLSEGYRANHGRFNARIAEQASG